MAQKTAPVSAVAALHCGQWPGAGVLDEMSRSDLHLICRAPAYAALGASLAFPSGRYARVMPDYHFTQVHEAIAAAVPEREALVFRDRRLSFGKLAERTRRLANHLVERGLRVRKERAELAGHESGQDHVALYLYNGNEYVEGMLGAFKARTAPLNVNYRYVEDELLYLFGNSRARAVIYHAEFAPRLAAIRDRLPDLHGLDRLAGLGGTGQREVLAVSGERGRCRVDTRFAPQHDRSDHDPECPCTDRQHRLRHEHTSSEPEYRED